jgi:hypothetical protein
MQPYVLFCLGIFLSFFVELFPKIFPSAIQLSQMETFGLVVVVAFIVTATLLAIFVPDKMTLNILWSLFMSTMFGYASIAVVDIPIPLAKTMFIILYFTLVYGYLLVCTD